jgi:hypothetical protein
MFGEIIKEDCWFIKLLRKIYGIVFICLCTSNKIKLYESQPLASFMATGMHDLKSLVISLQSFHFFENRFRIFMVLCLMFSLNNERTILKMVVLILGMIRQIVTLANI